MIHTKAQNDALMVSMIGPPGGRHRATCDRWLCPYIELITTWIGGDVANT
jgi:hypothetical protein